MSRDDKTYKSKVDWWLGLILILLGIYGLASLGAGLYGVAGGGGTESLIFLFAGLFTVALLALVVWPVAYVFTASELQVCFGRFRFRHPYPSLRGAQPTRNPLSAPALSLDRLAVAYEGRFGEILVSPADQEGFLRELADRCPHLEYADGSVRMVAALSIEVASTEPKAP